MNQNNKLEVENWKKLIREYFLENPRIDDSFVEEFFGKAAQARFVSKTCDDLHDAMLMNGLSGIDCRELDFSKLSLKNFTKIAFDTETEFPPHLKDVFSGILEKAKEFGFGLESLLQEGKLSGEDIHVAIIDENFQTEDLDENDFSIVRHDEYLPEGDFYHGKTVTSLLASRSCGVAKGAKVFFFERTSQEYRAKRKAYKEEVSQERMTEEAFDKWKKQAQDEELGNNISKIVEYNKTCKNDSDKITVLSGSWSIPQSQFEKWQQVLRSVGCEFVCQNNFVRNVTEISGQDIILEMTEEEKEGLSEPIKQTIESTDISDLIKIPINRTYHQYGMQEGFKYQASYSNSWGIPQVAGLLALYKKIDKTLTFEDFCSICKENSNEKGIINPVGIYEQVLKRGEKSVESISDDEGR